MRDRPWWQAALDVVVLVGALALATSAILPAFGGTSAVPALTAGLVSGAGLAVVAAWGRWSAWVVTAATVVVVVLLGVPLIGASTVLGVLPTPGAVGQVAVASVTTWKDVLTLDPPLGATGDVMLAPFLLALVGALVALSLALRAARPAVAVSAGGVVVLVAVVAALLGTATTPVPPQVVGAVVMAVLIVWAALRTGSGPRRRPFSAGALLAVAVVVSLGLAPVVVVDQPRFVLRDHLVPPFDPSEQPSPLAAFRAYVKADDQVLFTVSGLPDGARVRLAVLDRYDGTVWNVAGDRAAQGSGEYRRVGSTIVTHDDGVEAEVTIEIVGLTGVWLPTVGSALSFDAGTATRDVRYNDATGTAVLTTGVAQGLTYTQQVVVPNLGLRPADLGAVGSADVVLPDDTGVPGSVVRQAEAVARSAGGAVEQAQSLASWLSETGYFSHGLEGDAPSLAGHGAARMSRLVDAPPMVGDGEQYASALALMARSMNLRSRVVLGFVPGAGDAETAAAASPEVTDGVVAVRGKDVQAWVEIAFAGVGWVAFDATPPTSRLVPEQQQDESTSAAPQVVQPPVQPPAPQTEPEEDVRQPTTDGPREEDRWPAWLPVAIWTASGLGALLLLASPALAVLAVKARRRRRRRRASVPTAALTGGWQELVDVASDLRRAPSAVDTRRESARVVATVVADPALPDRLDDLAVRADRAAFAASGPTPVQVDEYWTEVDDTVRRMWQAVPWRSRIRGRVSTRSLRRRGAAPVAVGRRDS
ncbi:MAG: DUF3488 and transglutaminase-like domain-containing protein [Micrococcales bacterium]|nr:DUF3488 and transglutaminase-like domain-containing protein [Micrococcales bacterium]